MSDKTKRAYYEAMLERAQQWTDRPGAQARAEILSAEGQLSEIRDLVGPVSGHVPTLMRVAVLCRDFATRELARLGPRQDVTDGWRLGECDWCRSEAMVCEVTVCLSPLIKHPVCDVCSSFASEREAKPTVGDVVGIVRRLLKEAGS